MALSITFIHQVGAASGNSYSVPAIRGIHGAYGWVKQNAATDIHKLGSFRSAGLVIKSMLAIFTLHGLQILLFPSVESALYFSATSYSALGYGDVVLPLELRLLGPIGEHGRHHRGWSSHPRLVDSEEDPRRPKQPDCVIASRIRSNLKQSRITT